MAITSGFFSSLNGDRKYNSKQISEMFEGIIRDGIFQYIGDKFDIRASNGLSVTIGSGKAWFNGIWIKNDATYTQNIDPADQLLPRIDRIVIDVNSSEAVRAATIQYIKGTPNKTPKPTDLVKETTHKQYAICTISVKAGITSISNDDIKITTGTNETPFITGPLETVKMDWIIREWEAMLAKKDSEFTNIINSKSTEYDAVLQKNESDFKTWFDSVQKTMDGDVATNLANEMARLQSKMNNMYPVGSIFTSISPTNPSSFLGGVWNRFADGKTLIGVNSRDPEFNTSKKEGGNKTHTMTVDEMPSHEHFIVNKGTGNVASLVPSNVGDGDGWRIYTTPYNDKPVLNNYLHTQPTGKNAPMNILPPYVTVYFWIRVS